LTSGECENEGGYWYNDQCNSNEEPSCSNDLDLCEDETSCENEGGYWYNDQCNSNEEDEENNEEETTITIPESEPVITNDIIEICTPNWQCSDWSECVNETQTRTCEDVNNCGTEDGRPALLQSCTLPETCFDEIKNQDEIGVDCGGVCEQKCGIFTIMGSVITGPIESGKEFFLENKLRGFLILGGMVVLIGGGVAIGILSKKGKIKINLKKFIKKNIQNSSQGSTNV
jgi:hypothetical protein